MRVVACLERRDAGSSEGIAALRRTLAEPDTRVWVDIAARRRGEVGAVAELLELHPLIAEDIVERNQRAKVEETEGTIHVVMFWIAYEGAVTELEVDLVLSRRVAADGPRARLGPVHAAAAPRRRRHRPEARAGLPAVLDHGRHRRRVLPGPRRAR